MSAVPLRNNKATVCVARTVSVLGATGSIGDSTMDLLRGAPERYQVEALTANSNVAALAKLAREFNARFVAIADPDLLKDLQDALRAPAPNAERAKARLSRPPPGRPIG